MEEKKIKVSRKETRFEAFKRGFGSPLIQSDDTFEQDVCHVAGFVIKVFFGVLTIATMNELKIPTPLHYSLPAAFGASFIPSIFKGIVTALRKRQKQTFYLNEKELEKWKANILDEKMKKERQRQRADEQHQRFLEDVQIFGEHTREKLRAYRELKAFPEKIRAQREKLQQEMLKTHPNDEMYDQIGEGIQNGRKFAADPTSLNSSSEPQEAAATFLKAPHDAKEAPLPKQPIPLKTKS